MRDYGTITICKACGYRAPFYLFRPARKYPGTVHCPECDCDKTEAESLNGQLGDKT